MALPGTSETAAWGHPNFRVGKQTFVALEMHQGRPVIALRLVQDQVRELCRGGKFHPTPYGKGLWASIYADQRLNWRRIQTLIRQSYRNSAPPAKRARNA
jgi:predicted DNA-binding protein (MmcQ/YjbR family)